MRGNPGKTENDTWAEQTAKLNISIFPPMAFALRFGRILAKFARFWANFQYSPTCGRISKIRRGRQVLFAIFRPPVGEFFSRGRICSGRISAGRILDGRILMGDFSVGDFSVGEFHRANLNRANLDWANFFGRFWGGRMLLGRILTGRFLTGRFFLGDFWEGDFY